MCPNSRTEQASPADPLAGLSPQEKQTLETYQAQASAWSGFRPDTSFWAVQAHRFQNMLPEGHVLDVGCGTGRDIELLSSLGFQVDGLDLSEAMLKHARKRPSTGHCKLGSMYQLPYAKASYDGVWISAALLHAPKERGGEVLEEVRRVLRSGGTMFITVKQGEGEKMVEELVGGARFFAFYQMEEFHALLLKHGFAVQHTETRDDHGTIWLCAWATRT